MTDQEVFTKVKEHLLSQGCRSISEAGHCRYHYEELRCAVGCLIPVELYSQYMEGNRVFFLLNDYPKLIPFVGDNIDLLQKLQSIHDSWQPSDWAARLQDCAVHFGLSYG